MASPHALAVAECGDRYGSQATDVATLLAQVQGLRTCLADANDAATASIDSLSPADRGGATAASAFTTFRISAAEWCKLVSRGAGIAPDLVQAIELSCIARREHDLAQLIDGFVSFGDGLARPSVRVIEGLFPLCYPPYHTAIRVAVSADDRLHAERALHACVLADTVRDGDEYLIPSLTRAGVPEAEARAEVTGVLERGGNASRATCEVVVAASGHDDAASPVVRSSCEGAAAALFGSIVVELAH